MSAEQKLPRLLFFLSLHRRQAVGPRLNLAQFTRCGNRIVIITDFIYQAQILSLQTGINTAVSQGFYLAFFHLASYGNSCHELLVDFVDDVLQNSLLLRCHRSVTAHNILIGPAFNLIAGDTYFFEQLLRIHVRHIHTDTAGKRCGIGINLVTGAGCNPIGSAGTCIAHSCHNRLFGFLLKALQLTSDLLGSRSTAATTVDTQD